MNNNFNYSGTEFFWKLNFYISETEKIQLCLVIEVVAIKVVIGSLWSSFQGNKFYNLWPENVSTGCYPKFILFIVHSVNQKWELAEKQTEVMKKFYERIRTNCWNAFINI